MESRVFIFENGENFLNVIGELQKEYLNQQEIVHLSKTLESMADVEKELILLSNFNLNCYDGFRSVMKVKLTVTDGFKCKYSVTYCFNSLFVYDKFNYQMKKRQGIFI